MEKERAKERARSRKLILWVTIPLVLIVSYLILLRIIFGDYNETKESFDEEAYFSQLEAEYQRELEKEEARKVSFEILEGQAYFDAKQIQIAIEKDVNRLHFAFEISLGDSIAYPFIWEHGRKVKADRLSLLVAGKSVGGARCLEKATWSESLWHGECNSTLDFFPVDIKNLKAGEHYIELEITGQFQTNQRFLPGEKSPIKVKIGFHFTVEPIYETEIFFKSLVLDKAFSDAAVGEDDDPFDPGVDACVDIEYLGEDVLYSYLMDSYKLNGPKRARFYHNDEYAEISIELADRDNHSGDERISITRYSTKQLLSEEYIKLTLDGAEEFWMRSGKPVCVNSP